MNQYRPNHMVRKKVYQIIEFLLFCQICQWGQGEEQGLKRITKFSQVYLAGPFSPEKNIFCTFIEWDSHGSLKGLLK